MDDDAKTSAETDVQFSPEDIAKGAEAVMPQLKQQLFALPEVQKSVIYNATHGKPEDPAYFKIGNETYLLRVDKGGTGIFLGRHIITDTDEPFNPDDAAFISSSEVNYWTETFLVRQKKGEAPAQIRHALEVPGKKRLYKVNTNSTVDGIKTAAESVIKKSKTASAPKLNPATSPREVLQQFARGK